MIRPALPELTLPQMLRVQAQMSGHRIAVRQKRHGIWQPTTWRRYFERAADIGLGFAALSAAGPSLTAFVDAFAAGAILTMLAETMVPEAHEIGGRAVGLATSLGFAVAASLSFLT